ncbi:hypothetical protein Rpal_3024 [Rhodopseudomonas palustris TIE-1]|uniref:hypothetical protein n=1 Tax=Rhodopseudomonas palustris TaxID=1076 RepID=UPI0001779752|nr:hypothetical protein [Rhodopseudomonas palustris]ACF01530.1 hypothetical protein Rpal_3024 [Rhodopseudomonas palustris TIE-1]
MSRTLTEELALEQELLRRRVIHATRPRGAMNLSEEIEFCRRMEASPVPDEQEQKS